MTPLRAWTRRGFLLLFFFNSILGCRIKAYGEVMGKPLSRPKTRPRARAEARGGNGNGLLGWCRKALSAYTWCRSEKGPQNTWLFRIDKADTDKCRCRAVMTDTHVVEECPVASREGGMGWVERGPRGTGKKKERERGGRGGGWPTRGLFLSCLRISFPCCYSRFRCYFSSHQSHCFCSRSFCFFHFFIKATSYD